MNILITGAMGFIGRHLLEHLAGRHTLFAVARQRELQNTPRGVHAVPQDLTKPLNSSRFPKRIDAVIHLAQSDHYRDFPESAGDIIDVNVASTVRLLEYARQAGAECFVAASTGGVYGYGSAPFAETDPINPPDFYSASRYASEILIAPYQQFFRTIIFRFFFVYGPGQRRMLIPTLLGRLLRGDALVIAGNPGPIINPIYVGDAIRCFEPALALGTSGTFNIAGDEDVSITELVRLLEIASGNKARIENTEDGPAGNLVADISRMKSILGTVSRTSLRKGLAEVAGEVSRPEEGER